MEMSMSMSKRSLQIMKEITGKIKQNNNTFPEALKINKKSLHSTEKTANEFNSFFTMLVLTLRKIFYQSQQFLRNI